MAFTPIERGTVPWKEYLAGESSDTSVVFVQEASENPGMVYVYVSGSSVYGGRVALHMALDVDEAYDLRDALDAFLRDQDRTVTAPVGEPQDV